MDLATAIGLLAGVLVLFRAAGGDAAGLYDGTALLVVALGGFAATLVSFPLGEIVRLPAIVRQVFYGRAAPPQALIERIVHFAECARREGILSLERELSDSDPALLKGGVMLAVDGTEPKLIMDILETELQFVQERHARGAELMQSLGRNWATFGLVGALLVLALAPGAAASGLSSAALPLLYGAVLAGLIAWPFRRKLLIATDRETLAWRMTIEGIMAIQAGDNPRIVEHKLSVFLAPKLRPGGKPSAPATPPPAPDGQGAEEIAAYTAQNEERILRVVEETVTGRGYPENQKAEARTLVQRARAKELSLVLV